MNHNKVTFVTRGDPEIVPLIRSLLETIDLEVLSEEEVKSKIVDWAKHFQVSQYPAECGIIFTLNSIQISIADHVNSVPIFLSRGTLYFDYCPRYERLDVWDREFIHSGYSTPGYAWDGKTVVSRPGDIFIIDRGNFERLGHKPFDFLSNEVWSQNRVINELNDYLPAALSAKYSGDTGPIYLSLSGGFDSRLVLDALVQAQLTDRVIAFTYEYGLSSEVKVAQEVSTYFGVKHISLRPSDSKAANVYETLHDHLIKKKISNAIPYHQGLAAMIEIAEMFGDGVFLTGNSGDFILGGRVNPDSYGDRSKLRHDERLQRFTKKHFFRDYEDFASACGKDTRSTINHLMYEEFLRRQSQYVIGLNRSARAFNICVNNPLWDSKLVSLVSHAPLEELENRKICYFFCSEFDLPELQHHNFLFNRRGIFSSVIKWVRRIILLGLGFFLVRWKLDGLLFFHLYNPSGVTRFRTFRERLAYVKEVKNGQLNDSFFSVRDVKFESHQDF